MRRESIHPRMTCGLALLAAMIALVATTTPVRADEPPLGQLVADLIGADAHAAAAARQRLPRYGVAAIEAMIPHLSDAKPAAAMAAYRTILGVTNEVSAPGREAERRQATDLLMPLVAPDRPEAVRLTGLRLLERLVPAGYDVAPIAAMLPEPAPVGDRARAALERIGTAEAAAALSTALLKADAAMQVALLNSLATMQDTASLDAIHTLTTASDARVRAAAVRAMAWTGRPAYLRDAWAVVSAADDATRAEATDALLRLVVAMEQHGGNWQIVRQAYVDVLAEGQGVAKDAALAGLGRIGDESCVAPVLDAIQQADPRTRPVGLDALRRMQGVGVTRAIAEAYPKLADDIRVALIPVLGDRAHALVLPILQDAAKSGDATTRWAALAALGSAGQIEAMDVLAAAARGHDAADRATAAEALMTLARSLESRERKAEAGRAFLTAYQVDEDATRRADAMAGLMKCPVADAYPIVMEAAAGANPPPAAVAALEAVAGALAAAKDKDKTLAAVRRLAEIDPTFPTRPGAAAVLQQLGADSGLAAALGIITHWSIVGPFELGEQSEGWKTTFIGEPAVDVSRPIEVGGQTLTWKPVVSRDAAGRIDLRTSLGDRDKGIAYAYTEVTVPADTDAVLRVGSDDSARIWVNGEQVFDQFVGRALAVDQDRVPVRLRAGRNTILMKVWQNALAWEFCARITTPDGKPLAFTGPTGGAADKPKTGKVR